MRADRHQPRHGIGDASRRMAFGHGARLITSALLLLLALGHGSGLAAAAASAAATDHQSQAIKEFGVQAGTPITTGYLFMGNRYIDPPYLVERRGLAVFVNGILATPGVEWPPYDMRVETDPGSPPAGTSPWDEPRPGTDGRDEYWSKKCRFICSHFPAKEARAQWIALIKDLPQLAALHESSDSEWDIELTMRSGKTMIESLAPDHDKPMSHDELVASADSEKNVVELALRAGGVLGITPSGGEWQVENDKLEPFFHILFRQHDGASRVVKLHEAGFIRRGDSELDGLMATVQLSDALYLRRGDPPPSYEVPRAVATAPGSSGSVTSTSPWPLPPSLLTGLAVLVVIVFTALSVRRSSRLRRQRREPPEPPRRP